MSDDPRNGTEQEHLLDAVVAAYLEAVEAGQPPDRQELLRRHTKVAAGLAEFFADQDHFDRLAPPLYEIKPERSVRLAGPGAVSPRSPSANPDTIDDSFATRSYLRGASPGPARAMGKEVRYASISEETIASPASRTPPPRGEDGRRGRFAILGLYARGGLGQVSLAQDLELERRVALKEIRTDRLDRPFVRERFLNEAKITGYLEHPGIVPVYALGQDELDRPYYAMRFIEGRTLADAMRDYHQQPTPLAFNDLLRRFVTVCQTIAYAHSKDVIHRDLKPANIMLGEYGETLVVDWGLAKRVGGKPSSVAGPTGNPGVPFAEADPLTRPTRTH
jgi:predicted Ser/Thr protein kinase